MAQTISWFAALFLFFSTCYLRTGDCQLPKVQAPCTACKAVARTLQWRISKEKERQPVDLRHRLDHEGQRYGKVVAWKKSELRAVELLDDLCKGLKSEWSLVTKLHNDTTGAVAKKTRHWAKVSGNNTDDLTGVTRPSSDEEDALGKRLEAYCSAIIEEYEDDLYDGIRSGKFDNDGVEVHLCRRIITPCPLRTLPFSQEGVQAADAAADHSEVAPAPTGADEEGEEL